MTIEILGMGETAQGVGGEKPASKTEAGGT